MTRRPTANLAPALIAFAVALSSIAACSDGRKEPAALAPVARKQRAVFVVIGGRESSGSGLDDSLHTAWPQVVFSKQFPNGTVYLNLSRDDTTVAQARAEQAPLAVQQRPTVAAVWLGEGDDDAGTDPAQFERDLRGLLGLLRRGGASRVLVASPPPGAPGSRFATEIAGAARSTGAELVRLSTTAWNPHAPRAEQTSVQAAAASEIGRALKG
ncbi:MAG: hypothetical protein M3Z46_01930 [Actinomycetota bacterium]|nr:hypothetical protein [Actinomycetota bacterium]